MLYHPSSIIDGALSSKNGHANISNWPLATSNAPNLKLDKSNMVIDDGIMAGDTMDVDLMQV